MSLDLNNKKILLGITGSISVYKACEVARLFIKAGAEVHVVMTASAERFVSALTFEALTRNPVLSEKSESWSSPLNHIDMGKWCDLFVLVPATANTINKMSQGIADNILLQTLLACTKPIVVAPAANTNMIEHRATLASLKILRNQGVKIVASQNKLLACGDEGNGALADPLEIFYQSTRVLLGEAFWQDRKIVVTGGGTREKIDDVRYLSNFSSGKMANALATALYLRGCDVTLVTTQDHGSIPQGIQTVSVESAHEMLEKSTQRLDIAQQGAENKPYLFMVAAVSDFKPKYPNLGKSKKKDIGESWSIELDQNPDILKSINKEGIVTVGFKAEMDKANGFDNAKSLIVNKGVNAVCYNLLTDSRSFGKNHNSIIFITSNNSIDLGESDKLTVSFKILDESKKLTNE